MARLSEVRHWRVGAALAAALMGGRCAAQSFGMTASVIGAREIAGTDATQHVCQVLVYFSGGSPNVSQPHYSDTYTWSFQTTGGVVSVNGVTNGTTLAFTFPASTTLGPAFSGTLYGHRREGGETWDATNQVWVGWTDDWDQNVVYDPFRLRQFPVDVVAVDSRLGYGQPNLDGELPGDPNADLRNPSFANWVYRGGLFVGNASGVNGDQSGVARIQWQATDPGGLPNCVYTTSLLHIGTPAFFKAASSQWDGALTLNAYVPTGTYVPNVPISTITWANAMVPATSAVCGSLDITSAPANEYLNLTISAGFPYRLLMAASDESVARWRYFGASTYAPPSPIYPYSECKPHLWGCDVPSASGGTLVHTSHTGGTGGGGGGGTGGDSGGGGSTGFGYVQPPPAMKTKPTLLKPMPTKPKPVEKAQALKKTKAARLKKKGKGR